MYLRVKQELKGPDKKVIEKSLEDAGYTDIVVDVFLGSITVPDIYKNEIKVIIEIIAEAGRYVVVDGENEHEGGMFSDE